MAENSAIEWTNHTFNPWWGCQKVSPACDHCYAERDAKRFAAGQVLWGVGAERRTFGDKHWNAPIKWNDQARASREQLGHLHERPRVFCASMGDWLDLDAPISEFVRLLDLVRVTPELDWLLLSKRIGNWRKRLSDAWDEIMRPAIVPTERKALAAWIERWLAGEPPTNVWLGATIVNQDEYDRDIGKLLRTAARVHFLSVEPMLGPIDLEAFLWECCGEQGPTGVEYMGASEYGCCNKPLQRDALHWVICGGESGPGARPMHPDWARSLRDQCKAAGVPFLFKQWGEWAQVSESPVHPEATRIPGNLCRVTLDGVTADHYVAISVDGGRKRYELRRVGKRAAGRQLDGVQHDGYPA